jgi:hypothetical protein
MTRLSLTLLTLALLGPPGASQESDYQLKKDFEASYDSIKTAIDAANTTGALDTIAEWIINLEIRFAPRSAFLEKRCIQRRWRSGSATFGPTTSSRTTGYT